MYKKVSKGGAWAGCAPPPKSATALCNFTVLQSEEATQKKFLSTSIVTFDTKETILKMTLPQKTGSRIKLPSSKSLILLEKEFSTY